MISGTAAHVRDDDDMWGELASAAAAISAATASGLQRIFSNVVTPSGALRPIAIAADAVPAIAGGADLRRTGRRLHGRSSTPRPGRRADIRG